MTTIDRAIAKTIRAVLKSGARVGTTYVSATQTVRVSRRTMAYSGTKKFSRGTIELAVTVGKPNYTQRNFIKACRKAGEPFPVRKVQLKALSNG